MLTTKDLHVKFRTKLEQHFQHQIHALSNEDTTTIPGSFQSIRLLDSGKIFKSFNMLQLMVFGSLVLFTIQSLL